MKGAKKGRHGLRAFKGRGGDYPVSNWQLYRVVFRIKEEKDD
jgi:hypothetical protein